LSFQSSSIATVLQSQRSSRSNWLTWDVIKR